MQLSYCKRRCVESTCEVDHWQPQLNSPTRSFYLQVPFSLRKNRCLLCHFGASLLNCPTHASKVNFLDNCLQVSLGTRRWFAHFKEAPQAVFCAAHGLLTRKTKFPAYSKRVPSRWFDRHFLTMGLCQWLALGSPVAQLASIYNSCRF